MTSSFCASNTNRLQKASTLFLPSTTRRVRLSQNLSLIDEEKPSHKIFGNYDPTKQTSHSCPGQHPDNPLCWHGDTTFSQNFTISRPIPIRKVTTKLPTSSTMKGESSWAGLVCGQRKSGEVTRIFHGVYNYQWYRDFLIKKSYFGKKKTMSLGLLLDPIIGSPPSSVASPLIEARDDISALSEGFTRKVKLHRRLSTSFDEPLQQSGDGGGVGVPKDEKVNRLNSWLEEVHQEIECKAEESSARKGDSEGSSGSHGDNGGTDDDAKPAHRISEDLFQLLEKVIGWKGRNISHITVEVGVLI